MSQASGRASATTITATRGVNSATRVTDRRAVARSDRRGDDRRDGTSDDAAPGRPGLAGSPGGQHVDVRLTAEDGYQAQRTYSVASPPGDHFLELTVVSIDDGEVSPYLTTDADVGDQFELRGPVGGWFVWDGDDTTPVLLVGGGSGVVPLIAMMRHHARLASTTATWLIYSARTLDDVIGRSELTTLADRGHRDVTVTPTRELSSQWTGHRDRVDASLLSEVALATAGSFPVLRLWTDTFRRGRQRRPRRPRPSGRNRQDRTLWTDGRMG
jgi:Oxidoreductase NAD-binding domain/Oxidoreductase FAD-binding domain